MILSNFFSKLFNTNNSVNNENYSVNNENYFPYHTLENFILFVPSDSNFKVGDLIKHDLSYSISLRDNYCKLNYGIVIVDNYESINNNYVKVIGLETNQTKTLHIKMFNRTKYVPHIKSWNLSQHIELHSAGLYRKTRDSINLYVNSKSVKY